MNTLSFRNLLVPTLGLILLQPALSAAAQENGDRGKPAVNRHIDPMGYPITADLLLNRQVRDRSGEEVGEIETLVINRRGQVTHALLSFGGVMGVGKELVPLPWEVFQIRPDFAMAPTDTPLQLVVDRERLKDAPAIGATPPPRASDDQYATRLNMANDYFREEIKARHKAWRNSQQES